MERWHGRVALVTGASAGIGAAICRDLAEHGLKVVGCARNIGKIQELAEELEDCPGSVTALRCDLSQSDQIEALFRTIGERFGGVDICINNAGLSYEESLLDGDTDHWRTMLNVNVLAAAHCAQLAVRSMTERPGTQGQVININSVVGREVVPYAPLHFYSATKFALTALTEGLKQEVASLEAATVRVSQICPGAVNTSFFDRMLSDKQIVRLIESVGMSPAAIAEAVRFILATPHNIQVRELTVEPLTTKPPATEHKEQQQPAQS